MGTAILVYLGVVNVFAFALWGVDKWQAVRGRPRIRERTLLWTAFLAGAVGAWLGVNVFRHKSSKGRFLGKLVLVTAGNALWVWLWFAVGASGE